MFRKYFCSFIAITCASLFAQTQIDLKTQGKTIDFQGASYTKPMKTSAVLPATCSQNELLLLTSGLTGIYACISPNTWVLQGGSGLEGISVQDAGVTVGVRSVQNFVPGLGLATAVTDIGTKINVQQSVDTSVVTSQATLQSGQAVFCQSGSGSGSVYSCSLSPTLSSYAKGMVLYWAPDVNGSGGVTTLNVDLLGAMPVVRGDGSNPGSADLMAGSLYPLWFDGDSFRLIVGTGTGGGGSGSSTPTSITSTEAGGVTTLTVTSEWHSSLAYCSGPSAATLVWNTPPQSMTPAVAGGCNGGNVNDALATFSSTGTPSLQTSFVLPQTLVGIADVYITYLASNGGGTFTPALDVVCTSGNSSDDPIFVANDFFAPGPVIAPATANTLGTLSARGLSWPAGCSAGSRAHLRLIRTDTTGTAASISVAEVTMMLRRTL